MQTVVFVAIMGVVGVLSRYGIDQLLVKPNQIFPVSTLIINILGSFLAGCLYVCSTQRDIPSTLYIGLLIGFCGGFTTFSSYSLQTMTMIEQGRVLPALAYMTVSPPLGLLAAFIPVFIARLF